jgi:N-acyl-D-amino-acid deacylase
MHLGGTPGIRTLLGAHVYDVIIRGGTVVDGTGALARTADVAVTDGRIAEVGRVDGRAREVVEADGLLVTPGFVDPHTHYDGQATWDPLLRPSSAHGVTTAILGNCGVGFAPVRPDRRAWLVQLMEGVEDIPGTALHEGIRWAWETFPEYLDALATLPRAVDVAAHVPHGALRGYVMDERGADDEPATAADLVRMAELVEEAVRAGAIGFSTNRLPSHAARDGRPVPGTTASPEELLAIGRAVVAGGGGVIQAVSAEGMGLVPGGYRRDLDWLTEVSIATGLRTTLAVTQNQVQPELWRDVLHWVDHANAAGARITPQISGRPLGILLGWTTRHQFDGRPSYDEVAGLPLAERVRALADPDRRARILAERTDAGLGALVGRLTTQLFPLLDPPDYEPPADASIAAVCARTGRDADDVLYDLYQEDGGQRLVLFTLGGYAHHHADHIVEMLEHPATMLGLADGGAHCSLICDASVYTSMLSYWCRDRTRGRQVAVELAVAKMSAIPAELYGLTDRGTLRPGLRADINVIDQDRLRVEMPHVAHDLPAGAARVVQGAEGYVRTFVAGEAVAVDDTDTGARPGRLVRGGGARARV